MRDYIDRYIHDVIIRLNEEKREAVKKSLEAEIFEKLPEDYTFEDIDKVLKSLGHPSEVVTRYYKKEKYLIPPYLYSNYIRVLKVVTIFLGVFLFLFNFIQYSLALSGYPLLDMIGTVWLKALGGLITGFVYGSVLVTIVFIIMERTNLVKRKVKEWDLSDLPQLNQSNRKEINKFIIVFGILFNVTINVLLIFVFYHHQRFLGWYAIIGSENQIGLTVPLFTNYIINFIPIVFAMMFIQISTKIFILTQSYYSVKTDIMIGIENILFFSFLILFFGTKGMISNWFIIEASLQTARPFLLVQERIFSLFSGLEIVSIIIALGYLTWMVYRIVKHFQYQKALRMEVKNEDNKS